MLCRKSFQFKNLFTGNLLQNMKNKLSSLECTVHVYCQIDDRINMWAGVSRFMQICTNLEVFK